MSNGQTSGSAVHSARVECPTKAQGNAFASSGPLFDHGK